MAEGLVRADSVKHACRMVVVSVAQLLVLENWEALNFAYKTVLFVYTDPKAIDNL